MITSQPSRRRRRDTGGHTRLSGACCDSCALGDAVTEKTSPGPWSAEGPHWTPVVIVAALVFGAIGVFSMDKQKRRRLRYVTHRASSYDRRHTSSLPVESMRDVVFEGRR